jgi:uncharacterized protein YndB with AHSA1/START domain
MRQGRRIMVIALVIVGVLIGGVCALAAFKPDRLAIERTTHIAAPPEAVFALVNDFHQWPRWAPQDRSDPKMRRSYSGAPAGVGAASQWTSAGSAGEGHMQIIGATPPNQISVQVDFARPFTAHNLNEFSFAPEGSGTRVSWAMQGTNVFMAKLMSVFVNMDRMMGAHFEAGLRDLKAAAEGGSAASAPGDRE